MKKIDLNKNNLEHIENKADQAPLIRKGYKPAESTHSSENSNHVDFDKLTYIPEMELYTDNQTNDSTEFGDFPEAKDIKSTKGKQQRPHAMINIPNQAPAGFKFQREIGTSYYFLIPDEQETNVITNANPSFATNPNRMNFTTTQTDSSTANLTDKEKVRNLKQ